MGKNQNIGMMRKAAVMFLALGSMFSSGMGKASAHNTVVNRDAVKADVNTGTAIKAPERKVSGRSGTSSSGKRGSLNQRQYRKKVRSNPSILKSKKFRGKN